MRIPAATAALLACLLFAPAPAAGEEDEALAALVADVAAKVAEATGVPPAARPEVARVEAGAVAKLWRRRLAAVRVPERFSGLLAALGADRDAALPALRGIGMADTGAFLDAGEGVLYLAEGARSPVRALAAELVRSARGWEDFLAGPLDLDPFLARLAIVEGEASLVARALAGEEEEKSDFPPVVTAYLRGPLAAGERFLAVVREEEGTRGVGRLYVEPPPSTEAVLHPEKRLPPADRPDPVVLPDLGGVVPDGFAPAGEETLGEAALVRILTALVGRDRAAVVVAAATGWDGDRVGLWRRDGEERPAVVLAIAFDSRRDAAQLADLARAVLGEAADGGGPAVAAEGERVAIAGGFGAGANGTVAAAALRFERRSVEGDEGRRGMDAVTSRRAENRLVGALESRQDPAAPPPADLLRIRLSVRDGRTVFEFRGRTVEGARELDRLVEKAAAGTEKPPGEILAAPEVPHRDVIRVIDAFMKAGVRDITFRAE